MENKDSDSKAFYSYNSSTTQPKDPNANPDLHRQHSLQDDEPLDDPERQCKTNLLYEARARALAKQLKFFEAISCLEDIEQDEDEISQFGVNLLKAECYIQLGRENKAARSIKAVKGALLTDREVEIDLLINLAESLASEESFIRSMILMKVASDIYKESRRSASDILDGISRCIQVSKTVQVKIKDFLKADDSEALKGTSSERQRVIVLDFGVEYMKQMLNDLRAIPGADPEKQAIKVGWSVVHIGFVIADVGKNFDKSYKILKQGLEAMEDVFGYHAGHYRVYGVILHNMGASLHNNNKYAEAMEVYERSISAKDMALDFGGPEKQLDIEETRNALEISRKHMLFA